MHSRLIMYSRYGNNRKVTSTFNINDKHKYIGRKNVRIDKKKSKCRGLEMNTNVEPEELS